MDKNTLKDFFIEQNGKLLCISDDFSLFRAVRHAITPLGLNSEEVLLFSHDLNEASAMLNEMRKQGNPCIVVIDRIINGEKTTDTLLKIRRLYTNAVVIVVGSNLTKETIPYLHELGVKAVMSKPISADSILTRLIQSAEQTKEIHLKNYVRELISEARGLKLSK